MSCTIARDPAHVYAMIMIMRSFLFYFALALVAQSQHVFTTPIVTGHNEVVQSGEGNERKEEAILGAFAVGEDGTLVLNEALEAERAMKEVKERLEAQERERGSLSTVSEDFRGWSAGGFQVCWVW